MIALFPSFLEHRICVQSLEKEVELQNKASRAKARPSTRTVLLSLTKQQQKNHPWFIVNIVSKVWTTKKNSKHPHLPVEEQQSNPTVLLSMQKKNSNSAAQLDGLYYFKNSEGYN